MQRDMMPRRPGSITIPSGIFYHLSPTSLIRSYRVGFGGEHSEEVSRSNGSGHTGQLGLHNPEVGPNGKPASSDRTVPTRGGAARSVVQRPELDDLSDTTRPISASPR